MHNVIIVLIRTQVHVVWLVVKVPDQHPLVIFKVRNNAMYIVMQFIVTVRVIQYVVPWTLYPAGVVNIVLGLGLYTQSWKRVPHGIKKNKHGADTMLMSNRQVFLYTGNKPFCIF